MRFVTVVLTVRLVGMEIRKASEMSKIPEQEKFWTTAASFEAPMISAWLSTIP